MDAVANGLKKKSETFNQNTKPRDRFRMQMIYITERFNRTREHETRGV